MLRLVRSWHTQYEILILQKQFWVNLQCKKVVKWNKVGKKRIDQLPMHFSMTVNENSRSESKLYFYSQGKIVTHQNFIFEILNFFFDWRTFKLENFSSSIPDWRTKHVRWSTVRLCLGELLAWYFASSPFFLWRKGERQTWAVSYTHLTLPTILLV